jgi:hypothetical protein
MATIFYALIARDNHTVLADADLSSGNYPQLTFKVLEKNTLVPGFRSLANQEYFPFFSSQSIDSHTIFIMSPLILSSVWQNLKSLS